MSVRSATLTSATQPEDEFAVMPYSEMLADVVVTVVLGVLDDASDDNVFLHVSPLRG